MERSIVLAKKYLSIILCFLMVVGCSSENQLHPIEQDFLSPGSQVDLMAVIDGSCSMADDFLNVADNLYAFSKDLSRHEVDWNIAITSMDVDNIFLSEIPFYTISMGDDVPWEIASAIIELSSGGIYQETGFAAALDRIDTHSNWFRNGVPTVIVFVGDEAEQSNISPDLFMDAWPGELYVISVVGPYELDEPREYGSGKCYADPAPLYWEVADVVIDLCTEHSWNLFGEINSITKEQ